MTRVRPLRDDERAWVNVKMRERWGDETVVGHGVVYRPATLPGLVADDETGEAVGLLTYTMEGRACEVVTIDTLVEGAGHGRALLEAVESVARTAGCERLWLITTNDNTQALGFYAAMGFEIVAVHTGAVEESRRSKPSIPAVSEDGVPITDEIELERRLS